MDEATIAAFRAILAETEERIFERVEALNITVQTVQSDVRDIQRDVDQLRSRSRPSSPARSVAENAEEKISDDNFQDEDIIIQPETPGGGILGRARVSEQRRQSVFLPLAYGARAAPPGRFPRTPMRPDPDPDGVASESRATVAQTIVAKVVNHEKIDKKLSIITARAVHLLLTDWYPCWSADNRDDDRTLVNHIEKDVL